MVKVISLGLSTIIGINTTVAIGGLETMHCEHSPKLSFFLANMMCLQALSFLKTLANKVFDMVY
jgi:hypothetical protein